MYRKRSGHTFTHRSARLGALLLRLRVLGSLASSGGSRVGADRGARAVILQRSSENFGKSELALNLINLASVADQASIINVVVHWSGVLDGAEGGDQLPGASEDYSAASFDYSRIDLWTTLVEQRLSACIASSGDAEHESAILALSDDLHSNAGV